MVFLTPVFAVMSFTCIFASCPFDWRHCPHTHVSILRFWHHPQQICTWKIFNPCWACRDVSRVTASCEDAYIYFCGSATSVTWTCTQWCPYFTWTSSSTNTLTTMQQSMYRQPPYFLCVGSRTSNVLMTWRKYTRQEICMCRRSLLAIHETSISEMGIVYIHTGL